MLKQLWDSEESGPSGLSVNKNLKLMFKNPNKLTEEEIVQTLNSSFSDNNEITLDDDYVIDSDSDSNSDSGRCHITSD